MFKKLRDKISEEVQQTSLRLPVTVQHLSQLSPFGSNGGETGFGDASKNAQNLHDELLVDISDIQPAGDNKDLFSIDEDSREGSPSKSSEFQVVELTDENINEGLSTSYDDNHNPFNQRQSPLGIGGGSSLPNRRLSDGSQISDMSNLFPIYEVPGVSFNVPQSDLESCSSEWEDGNNALDRLSKDTVYQAYLRMRQRYHKYKGRYSDVLRVYKEKDKETEKLRDVLTKQQDKALRRISELREQCSLEQQAKAHLEEELRSDLEEKDHKIEALQTKVRLLQEGCFGEISLKGLNISEGVGLKPPTEECGGSGAPSLHGEFDTVSVGSLGSLAAPSSSVESEEVIDKLRDDLAKHKTLLGRCMDNIRSNKERISNLLQERDAANAQIKEKENFIESLKTEYEGTLESLRATLESSALSMAETKQQLFEELQTKEQEVERYRRSNISLQKTIDRLKEEFSQGRMDDEEVEINLESQSHVSGDDVSVKSFENLELKVTELENLIGDLQRSKMNLEMELKQLKEEKESRDSGYFVTGNEKETNTLSSETSKERIESPGSSDQTLNSLQENMEDSAIDVESSLSSSHPPDDKTRSDQDLKSQNLVDLSQQLKQLRIECERLKSENEALSSELHNLNDENESLNAEVSSLNDENETLHRDFKALENENEKLDSMLKDQINKNNEKISSLQRELNEVKENVDLKEREKEELDNLFKKLGNDFEDLKNDNIKLKTEINNLNDSLIEKSSLIKTLEQKLVAAEKHVTDTSGDYHKTVEEVNSLRKSISDCEKEMENLKSGNLEYKQRLGETNEKLEREVKLCEKLKSKLGDVEDRLNKDVNLMDDKISVADDIFCKLEAVLSSRLDLISKTKAFAKENNELLSQIKDLKGKLCDFDQISEKYSSISVQYESLQGKLEAITSKEKELNILNEELNNKLQESDKDVVRLKDETSNLEKVKLERDSLRNEYDAYKSSSQSEIESLNCKLQSIELEKNQLNEDRIKDRENLEIQIKDIENQKENLISDLKNAEERYESLLKEIERIKIQLLEEEKENKLLKQNLNQFSNEKEEVCNQMKSLVSDKEKLSCQLKSLADEKQSVESQLSALSDRLDSLSAEKENLSTQVTSLSKEIEDLTTQFSSLSNEKEELSLKFNSLLQVKKDLLDKFNVVSCEKDDLTKKVTHLLSEKEVLSNSLLTEKGELSTRFQILLNEKEELSEKFDLSLTEKEELSNKFISLLTEKEELSNSFMMEKKELSNQINELLTEKEKLCHEFSVLKMEQENLCSQLISLSSSKEEISTQVYDLTVENKKILNQLNELVTHRDGLTNDLKNISTNRDELSRQLSNSTSEKIELSEKIQALSLEQTKLYDQLNTLSEEKEGIITKFNQDKECLSNQINSLMEDKEASVSEQSSLSEECEKLSNSLNTLTVEKEELRKQVQTFEEEKKNLLTHVNSLKEEKEKLIENSKSLQSDVRENLNAKENLQKELKDHLVLEKELKTKLDQLKEENESLEQLVNNLKHKLNAAEKSLVENSKILDQEWQQKLRFNKCRCISTSFVSNRFGLVFYSMLRIAFELEKLQTEHSQRLADCMGVSAVAKEAERNQCAATAAKEESFRQSIEKKDAEIIRLMDEKDSLQFDLEEKEQLHRQVVLRWEEERKAKEQQLEILRKELYESKCQLDKQVQELESSNSDLRQKIDELQNELNHLEILSKEENLNEIKNKEEKRLLEEQLKEKAIQLAKVLEEKIISEERLQDQVVNLTKTVEEIKLKEEQMKTRLSQLTKENEEKTLTEGELNNQIAQLSHKVESLTQTETKLLNQISHIEEEAKQSSSRISESNEKIKTYTQKIAESEIAREELQSKVDELSKKIDTNDISIVQLNKDIELKSSKILEVETKESELLTKISTLEENLRNTLEKQKIERNSDLTESKMAALEEKITRERLKISELNNENGDLKKELENMKDIFKNSTEKLEDELHTSYSKVRDLEDEIETFKQQLKVKDNLTDSLELKLKVKQNRLDALIKSLGDVLQIIIPDDSESEESSIIYMIKDLKNKNLTMEQRLLEETEIKEQLTTQIEDLRSKLMVKDDEVNSLHEKEKLQKENIQEMIKRLCSVPLKESSDMDTQADGTFTDSDEAREKAIQKAIESCKSEIYAEYEERLSGLRKRHEEERRIWKAEALEVALRKEEEMKAKMDLLTSQNFKEKKELERLTRVAANAFKSGSESVDLLRDQVTKQRLEMEETKRKHLKEVEELKTLLEVKRRKGRGGGGGGHGEFRNSGGSLEDAAEFEYLRNILYQYMIGKETQTLAKVLCAVVKFSKDQQRQIIDHEDRKQSLLQNRLESERRPLPENS